MYRESILAVYLGDRQPEKIHVESMAPLSPKDLLRLKEVRKAIDHIEPQLNANGKMPKGLRDLLHGFPGIARSFSE
ncbi:MAG: hypothetical protein V7631_4324 [Massilia sp.]|jgi:hypothetical protein